MRKGPELLAFLEDYSDTSEVNKLLNSGSCSASMGSSTHESDTVDGAANLAEIVEKEKRRMQSSPVLDLGYDGDYDDVPSLSDNDDVLRERLQNQVRRGRFFFLSLRLTCLCLLLAPSISRLPHRNRRAFTPSSAKPFDSLSDCINIH